MLHGTNENCRKILVTKKIVRIIKIGWNPTYIYIYMYEKRNLTETMRIIKDI